MCNKYPPDPVDCVDYVQDLMPIFRNIFGELDKLDALEIRSLAGNRLVDRLEDAVIRVVYAAFKATNP